MSRTTSAHPSAVRRLVLSLTGLGVTLPPDVTRADAQLSKVGTTPPAELLLGANLVGLTDAQFLAFQTDYVNASIAHSHGSGAFADVRRALAVDLADALAGEADDVLDQLRPTFTAAAEQLHRAAELGLGPTTTADDILRADNVAELRDAWAEVARNSRVLEEIAQARVLLSSATGVPPAERRIDLDSASLSYAETFEIASRSFRTDGRAWESTPNETPWRRWLRLSVGSPARLLTLDECLSTTEAGA
jgi:hypothetical protein